jgi:type IV secretory pathway VirB2 component (pilin)
MRISKSFCLFLVLWGIFTAKNVVAAGSGMPWESPLMRIMDSCTGPVAQVGGTLAILFTGGGIAFGEGGGLMRKVLNVVFGLSICFTAGSFMLNFLGYGGGIGFGD